MWWILNNFVFYVFNVYVYKKCEEKCYEMDIYLCDEFIFYCFIIVF